MPIRSPSCWPNRSWRERISEPTGPWNSSKPPDATLFQKRLEEVAEHFECLFLTCPFECAEGGERELGAGEVDPAGLELPACVPAYGRRLEPARVGLGDQREQEKGLAKGKRFHLCGKASRDQIVPVHASPCVLLRLARQPKYQLARHVVDRRPARTATWVRPMLGDESPVRAQTPLRPHYERLPAIARKQPAERREQQPVGLP